MLFGVYLVVSVIFGLSYEAAYNLNDNVESVVTAKEYDLLSKDDISNTGTLSNSCKYVSMISNDR